MEISSVAIQKTLSTAFKRYHLIIYVIVVGGALTAAVLTLYAIVNSSSENDSYTSPIANAKFDNETIDRVNNLKDRDQNRGNIDFPSGRINPFIE